VLFDFGGSDGEDAGHVLELWAQYGGLEPFHLRVGAFAPSFGLEDQNSTNGMPLLERRLPSEHRDLTGTSRPAGLFALAGSAVNEGARA
jgi:hypothetical protein